MKQISQDMQVRILLLTFLLVVDSVNVETQKKRFTFLILVENDDTFLYAYKIWIFSEANDRLRLNWGSDNSIIDAFL